MRLTNFLFAAAAALLASCEATSAATDSTQTKLSTMTSPNAVQSIDATHTNKRFLRTTKKERYEGEDSDDDLDSEDDDDDDDDDDSEDEERGFSINGKADDALRKLIGNLPGAGEKISNWRSQGVSSRQVRKELGLKDIKNVNDPNTRLYKLFLTAGLRENFKLS